MSPDSPPCRAAFWVTAGGRHGGGHLSRAMALVEELPEHWETLLVLPDNEYTRALHAVGGPPLATHPDVRGWSSRMIFHCIEGQGWEDGPELIVIDGLWTPEDDLPAELRKRWPGTRIAIIGGPAATKLEVDLRIFPEAAFQPVDDEETEDEPRARTIGGPGFVILNRPGEPRTWSPPASPARILVTAGNADPFDATCLFIAALESCRTPVAATVVLGGGFLHADRVRERVALSTANLELVERVHDQRPLMRESDLALATYGASCLELAQMGVPTVSVVHAEADLEKAGQVSGLGFLTLAGRVETTGTEELAGVVDGLLEAPEKLKAMSEAGRDAIDGRGAHRVAGELRQLVGRD